MNTLELTVERLITSMSSEFELQMEKELESAEQIMPRLYAYQQAIASNFVSWMTNVWLRCESERARRVCQENLRCEIVEDHPAMLVRYINQGSALAPGYEKEGLVILERLQSLIPIITALTQQSDAHDGLLIMAGLENASLVLIPQMRRWGQALGFTDFEYVDKRGMAAITHAQEFTKAVCTESPDARLEYVEKYSVLHYVEEVLITIFS